MKVLIIASLSNVLALAYNVMSVIMLIPSQFQKYSYYFRFSEISMSRHHAAKSAVFQGFCPYFGLNMVYSVAISLHMTRYKTKTQKKLFEKG